MKREELHAKVAQSLFNQFALVTKAEAADIATVAVEATLDALEEEAQRKSERYGGGIDYLTNNAMWTMTGWWLRYLKGGKP